MATRASCSGSATTTAGRPLIDGMRRVSRARAPRLRRRKDELPRVRNGLGIAVLSTSRGVLSDREAREQSARRRAALRGLVAMSRIGNGRPIAIPKGVTVERRAAADSA